MVNNLFYNVMVILGVVMCKSRIRSYFRLNTLYCFLGGLLIALGNLLPYIIKDEITSLLFFKLGLVLIFSFLLLLFVVNMFREFKDIKLDKRFWC